jgi:drug/metabolite transporter (DMT)-like permease
MPNTRWYRKPLVAALLFGGGYAIAAAVMQIGSPAQVLVAALLMAGLGWLMASRRLRGKDPVSLGGMVAMGVGGLILYTVALILSEPPARSEWLFVAIVFAFPVALLVMAYLEWRRRVPRQKEG